MKIFLIIASLFALAITSCSTDHKPILASSFQTIIDQKLPERNPVIVIPGVLGSKLLDHESNLEVWGAFAPGAANPKDPASARVIAIPMEKGKSLAELKDGVQPNGVLDRLRVTLLPGLKISPRAYSQILGLLGAGGYLDESLVKADKSSVNYGKDHFSCFQFSYDWRRSNAENAAHLHAFIESRRQYVAAQRKEKYGSTAPVKFDIVAHSMGGLVARYYLRYGKQQLPSSGLPSLTWAGKKHIDKVVLIGSPHFGSPKAIQQATDGLKLAPFTPHYNRAILGTMPSLYELFPRGRHNRLVDASGNARDPLDIQLWKEMQWGMFHPKADKVLAQLLPNESNPQARLSIAEDHLRKCLHNANQFQKALDRKATNPPGLKIVTWVGVKDSKTDAIFLANPLSPKVISHGVGDGTVERYSAVADERGSLPTTGKINSPVPWGDINYIYKDHVGLTSDANFSDNVLAFLLGQGGSVGE